MGWQTLREAIPTVVMHMAAAAIHLMATAGVGGTLSPLFGGFVAALLLASPMIAVLAMLSGFTRLGALLCALSFVGTAGLTLFGHVGLGLLQMALHAPSSPWRTLFFATAMLLPLLQITGIIEAIRLSFTERESHPRLVDK